ncbi:MAG: metal-dependent hydrolase [Cyclobacteriaceae bacterium]
MASAFGHAFAAFALGTGFPKPLVNWKFWTLGMVCAILPDADVLGLSFGIPYGSFWGHRGFTHSWLFSLLIGVLVTRLFYRTKPGMRVSLILIAYFTLCTASHSVLDALTSGGMGVAFFSPWDNTRYFLPGQPIQVSPIGIRNFFTERGIRVILSELVWIGIPGLLLMGCSGLVRMIRKRKTE